jgi:hypothetical protein
MSSKSNFLKLTGIVAVAALLVVTHIGGGVQAGPMLQGTATMAATHAATVQATSAPTVMVTTASNTPTNTLAAPTTIPATLAATTVRPATLAATTVGQSATATCVPAQVTVFTKSPRIQVKCTAPTENILYFAVATTDAALAQRVLTVLTDALTSGKALSIVYDPSDLSGQDIGCLSKDCRLIVSVSIVR